MANKLNQDIEQISQEKEKQELFVSSLSHEISTPLTSIIGYAQMLQWEDLKEPSSEFVDYILEESFRLKSLSEDVLRLLYSKKNEMNLEAISTDQIDSYITQFVSGLDERILLQMTLQKATIRMDFNLFKLVIANIFSNALDAMKDRKEMCITGYSNEGRYYFILKDTGQGIPEEIIDQVTDEFFTGDVTRNSGHLGLGLSLVKNIISLHEGQVTITSEKGEGTFITIDFPLDED
ncbi:HAMP domain-containing histidine kinase [Enterococcus gallinarum]|nr:HAMP domain-containing histidine kinase [Enterococcus gallinarum]MCW3745886.1 HAMP domain-containing histidine kinase [Enterococcus gallinarum]